MTQEELTKYEKAIREYEDYATTEEGEFELGERTVVQYISTIKDFGVKLGNKDPLEIIEKDIDFYLQRLRKAKYSSSSVRNKLSALKSFFYVLTEVGTVKNDPTLEVKLQQRRGKRKKKQDTKKELTKVEMEVLLETLDNWRYKNGKKDRYSDRDKLMVEIMYSTGMRRSELVSKKPDRGVYVKNINFEASVMRVKRKGGFMEDVVITDLVPDLGEKIQEWIKLHKLKQDEKLFNIGDKWFNEICKKWGRRAGFTFTFTSHWIRHTFGSVLGNLGVPAQIIQDLMDHSSITTTDQYVKTTKEGAMNVLFVYGLFKHKKPDKDNFDKVGVDFPI